MFLQYFFSDLCYIILYSILLRKSKSVAFFGVFFVHAMNNLIAVIYDWF